MQLIGRYIWISFYFNYFSYIFNCFWGYEKILRQIEYTKIYQKMLYLILLKNTFNISNENNGNKDFILDSYIDKLEITKINFKYNVINTDIILDTWILELNQFENETRAILTFIRKDALNGENIKELNNNVHNLLG